MSNKMVSSSDGHNNPSSGSTRCFLRATVCRRFVRLPSCFIPTRSGRCSGKFVAPENYSHTQQYGLGLKLKLGLNLGLALALALVTL